MTEARRRKGEKLLLDPSTKLNGNHAVE